VLELVELGLVELGLLLELVELGLVDDGLELELVLDGLVLELVLLELLELPWEDDDWLPCPPWPLTLSSCHGTGHSLLSAEMTAKSILPLVGFTTTSSMRPTSSPELVLTCAPTSLVLRRCCCWPAYPLPRPVALKLVSLDWLDIPD
jgi:hypothetical protein